MNVIERLPMLQSLLGTLSHLLNIDRSIVEAMHKTVQFVGTIRTITRDGRSGVVELDQNILGKGYAVISPDTRGRIKLMNGVGHLEAGTKVAGTAEDGSEALRAISVSAFSR